MKKVSEHRIEQYLRFPDELNSEERKEIRQAIQQSPEARELHDYLKDFYTEFDRISRSQAFVIPLKAANEKSIRQGPVVLAAMTPKSNSSSSLLTKATLISKEHKALVRVLEDQKDRSLQFHVLGERPHLNERAILSLIDPEIDLVTDKYGRLKHVKELSDIHWQEVSTLLRLPVFKKEVQITTPTPFRVTGVSGTDILINRNEDTLTFEFEKSDHRLTRVLLVQDNSTELFRIDHLKLTIDISKEAGASLYFYE